MRPKITPMTDMVCIFLPCKTRIMTSTTSGCADISKAANPLSIYFNAQTTTPLPKVRNKKPANAELRSCFREILIGIPVALAIIKINIPAEVKRNPANMKGDSSPTAILFKR